MNRTPYNMAFACFDCCKSFKREFVLTDGVPLELTCPNCSGSSHNLGRHFKPPKKTDDKQWAKVRYLFDHGFRFQKIRININDDPIPYPETLEQAKEFVVKYKKYAIVEKKKESNEARDRYDILENAESLKFSDIEPRFVEFISKYVAKNRRQRWLSLVTQPKQLSKKFGNLWDHLEIERSLALKVANLPEDTWIYFDRSFDPICKFDTQYTLEVGLGHDGMAFSVSGKLVIFFTHEDTEYVFEM